MLTSDTLIPISLAICPLPGEGIQIISEGGFIWQVEEEPLRDQVILSVDTLYIGEARIANSVYLLTGTILFPSPALAFILPAYRACLSKLMKNTSYMRNETSSYANHRP